MILLQLGHFLWYNCMPVATELCGVLTLERMVAHGNEDPQDKWKVGSGLGGGSHHLEGLKGVRAVGPQACQLLIPLQP